MYVESGSADIFKTNCISLQAKQHVYYHACVHTVVEFTNFDWLGIEGFSAICLEMDWGIEEFSAICLK